MKNTGTLYCPESQHCWATNLAGVLGHVRKGSEFVVRADILEIILRTFGSTNEHSAFLREICVALKAGYTLSSDGREIVLRPVGLRAEYLRSLDTTAALGDGVNPSFAEIEAMFSALKIHLEARRPFVYKYDGAAILAREVEAVHAVPAGSAAGVGLPASNLLAQRAAEIED